MGIWLGIVARIGGLAVGIHTVMWVRSELAAEFTNTMNRIGGLA